MNITPLPLVEKVVEIIGEYQQGRAALHCEMRDRVTQDRDHAYTSLIKGIEDEILDLDIAQAMQKTQEATGYNQALKEIIEKVVKPVYGKE